MTDKIKMIAGDTVSITAVQSEPLRAGDPFEVDNETDAVLLEAAGHKRAGAQTKAAAADAKPAAKPTKATKSTKAAKAK